MNTRIDRVEIIKKNLEESKYIQAETLEEDIENLVDEFWNDNKCVYNDDLFDMDMKELGELHTYLIKKVGCIHKSELEIMTKELIENNTDMKFISENAADSSSYYKIYTFNKDRDYIFVGDLHSDDYSLKRVLKDANFFESIVSKKEIILIFNGDYVDRGKSHLKIMERILLMKYLFPNHIFMLRGNHDGGKILEDASIKLPYGVPKEDDVNMYFPKYIENLILKNKTCPSNLLREYLDFFDTLAYIAIVSIKEEIIMAVHGGLPRPNHTLSKHYDYMACLKDITDEGIVDEIGRSMCQNIMWSDPYRDGEYREKTGRFHYKQEHIDSFMEKFKVDFIIRGHEEAHDGYCYALDKKVVTIFSSGSLDHRGQNTDNEETWYRKVSPKILRINFEGEREFI